MCAFSVGGGGSVSGSTGNVTQTPDLVPVPMNIGVAITFMFSLDPS